ncbi:HNH endonuclease [Thermanaerosceptrum fracticalcis]|uniref:HNH endonuclease n=1 Tax=Thermanaerosceptrum fracticalcis TaxID=1712410 RepID=A0A7G6E7Z2_THEFR|nr:HNH endonuclease signature motif containing protein [Thermanaerosceptrum fracticalcis]QNB48196.1 HNH endonuclease [Thermanaerosceptrum fracticalcis]
MTKHYFTSEHREFIKDRVKGRSNAELTEMFNRHFGLNLTCNQIKVFKKNHKLNSGLTGQFKPGHIPFNKGKKGINCGGKATQFKKGHAPWNYKPIGTERISADGYVEVKAADPNKWKAKHVLIWEAANGPVPKGHAVIFGDGNKRNLNPENLILVSREQLVRLNQKNLIQNDVELTKAGIIIADIYNKIGELRRGCKKKRGKEG